MENLILGIGCTISLVDGFKLFLERYAGNVRGGMEKDGRCLFCIGFYWLRSAFIDDIIKM